MDEAAMQRSQLVIPKPSFTIDVKFQDLQLTLKNGTTIMAGVTGELRGGHGLRRRGGDHSSIGI